MTQTQLEHPFLSRMPGRDEEQRALELHARATVVDTCGAIPPGGDGSLDDSIALLRLGGVDCVGMTLSAEEHDQRAAMDQITFWNRNIRKHSADLVKATCADDVRQAKEDGRIAVYYLFQNAKPFGDDPGNVELFRDMGVVSSAITYNKRNFLGDGCAEPEDSGISTIGREMIAEMNRVGMLVDLSHGGKRTQLTAAQASTSAPYFSHNNCFSVFGNRRNATDQTMRVVAEKGGMMSSMPLEISDHPQATVAQMGDHLMHTLEIFGPSGVGICTDFPKGRRSVYETAYIDQQGYLNIQYDGTLYVKRMKWEGPGCLQTPPWYPYAEGVTSYAGLPNITRELVLREVEDSTIVAALGGNFIDLMSRVVG
ncbi:membrane dipeptidase [Paenarthrobacter sp. NPDC058040]|uniref:membrane dipeptidase n=1 Tax=unclassified Paenarthrobacter TaxID=2634190 RepID=UPI0036DF06CE